MKQYVRQAFGKISLHNQPVGRFFAETVLICRIRGEQFLSKKLSFNCYRFCLMLKWWMIRGERAEGQPGNQEE